MPQDAQDAALENLRVRREEFKILREQIDAELAAIRAERIAEASVSVESALVDAFASGASLAKIKVAYGTKDHKTITTLRDKLVNRALATAAVKDAPTPGTWFEYDKDRDLFRCVIGDDYASVEYQRSDEGDSWLFLTQEPLWNADMTVRNEVVNNLDGAFSGDNKYADELTEFLTRMGA